MYCLQCGTELPDDARFCLKCGKLVKAATTPSTQPQPRWEYCEITWTKAGWLDGACFFWAEGIGPRGVSEVAKGSKKFAVGSTILGPNPSRKDKKTVAACDELVQVLVSSGWEPLSEKGHDWWSYKFRRSVKHSMSGNIPTDLSSDETEDEEAENAAEEFVFLISGMLQEEKYDEALATLDDFVELLPDFHLVYYYRGRARFGLQQYQKAITDFDRAIQLEPKHTDAYYFRGRAYSSLQQYQKAITDFDYVIQLDAKDANIYLHRGFAYSSLQQYQKAIADFDRTIQLDPKPAEAYCFRGSANLFLGQLQKAITDFDRTLELYPNHPIAQKFREHAISLLKRQ